MSSPETAPASPPRLVFCLLLLAVSIAAALVFARAFKTVPDYVFDPAMCGDTAPAVDAHAADHAKHATKSTEPQYNAGGLLSIESNLRGLADLLFLASSTEGQLLCQSVSWHNGQLVVVDTTPIQLGEGNDGAYGLVVVAVDHTGSDIEPDFANAIRDHLESLSAAKQILFLTPLRGPDKRPKREDPYDWTFLASSEALSSKTEIVDFSDMKIKADLPGRLHSGALLTVAEDLLDEPSNSSSVNELVEQLGSDKPGTAAYAGYQLAQRNPYQVIPAVQRWVGDEPTADKLYQSLMLRRGLGVHADVLIAAAAESEDLLLRALAARAIGDLAEVTTDPLALLTPLAEDSALPVRYEALISTRAVPGRRAAGVAQLVEPYEMTAAMRVLYLGTMAELASYGEPIAADSKFNRTLRMPLAEALALERDMLVCKALLQRTDLPDGKISELLTQLGKVNDQSSLEALIDLLSTMSPTAAQNREPLLRTLIDWDIPTLRAQQQSLGQYAMELSNPKLLRTVFAAALARTLPGSPGFDQADGMEAIMYESLAWVKDEDVLKALAPLALKNALGQSARDEAGQIAALDAIKFLPTASVDAGSIPGILKLAREAESIDLRFAAIRAINALPDSVKPPDISDLALTPLTISAVKGNLAYDKTTLTIPAGQPIELTLVNPDAMEHNLVITKPGTGQAVGVAGAALSASTGYIPESDDVLYATPLVKPGASYTLRFIAPTKPGQYDYVCTFPGHPASMKGVLEVTAP